MAKSEIRTELPNVDSPPISPGTFAIEPIAAAPAIEPIATPAPASATPPRFTLNRNALLAASVAIAAAFGAVIGAVASGGFAAPARTDIAGLEERKAMQQSISNLTKEITTLKASVQAANKSAHTQIAKNTERLDQAAVADITGSIMTPQTVAPISAPLPTPRPAPRVAALETPPIARPPVVQDWTIRDARDGFVYVQGHGDIYQVVPGAPLPGLGPVQSIKRQDGRWVVSTPKGIIVSLRDRRYFETY